MNADRANLPLVSALQHWATHDYAPFHTPGHKRGQGSYPQFLDLIGTTALQADLPELPDLDNLFAPQGVIDQAQKLAAATFGAEHTYFLANGSTGGIIAAILATCQPGDKIILPRNVHQSIISGLILAGTTPIFVMPEYDRRLNIAHGVSADAIAQTIQKHPNAKAVLIIHPTYYGVCSDIRKIVQITNQANIPLIVDEAHGAHFHFHPELPTSAMAAGADIAIQSTHKTLSALTQAAMLHLQGSRIDPDRIRRSLSLIQSTSPNYLLLASLDAARAQMATTGAGQLTQTLSHVDEARKILASIPHIHTLTFDTPQLGWQEFDRTRLTVTVAQLGLNGFTADEILSDEYNVMCELPSLEHLTFIFSIGTTAAHVDRLVTGIQGLADREQRSPPITSPPFDHSPSPAELSPREAFFATPHTLPTDQAIGHISAELICPYPPGIPVLLPGETITADAIAFLQTVQRSGGMISGCSDPELHSLQVISQ
ncbi:aminotransferase class I/II-fold pyridoxal phosphate-dependent enzyme [filamentous cyanobacterium LEGE 11480]|uniref:Aminotransferase class I/II-fold pyridoxal phosphate-dependent enzyme n=1 Tax=Romeriopsis navalis LEGE 11480 TaxID=2777977 RepID=A0A928VSG3_9CYAN|nr:aminotransferase class I/II-fold pyridoxal phosphate-dependent enzyme [Romeriopsis navalis]MBE9031717.1 aminotransferase class I/II-fold pyridoxal phosphate-dependent enzyme [Romeriopsis navalis LEGE 11480]